MGRVELNKAAVLVVGKFHARQLVYKASLRTTAMAKTLVSVDTGQTRASIMFNVRDVGVYKVVGRVGSNLKKAHYLHEGTRAHKITARRKKALKFESGGVIYVRRSVNHPGIGSTPFLTTAMRTVCTPLNFKIDRRLPARLRPTSSTLAP